MKLSDFNHLREDRRVSFKQEQVNGETVTIICYAVASPDLWDIPLAKECRGIVFDSNGNCISRPLHKFMNVGECEATQVHNLPELTEVLEKRDGSLLVPVMVGGKVAWKTKKSFYSDVAIEAARNVPENVVEFSEKMCRGYLTAIYEFCSPNNRIVIDYGEEPSFTLIAIRDNYIGQYVSYESMKGIAETHNIPCIQKFNLTLQDCIEQSKTLENFEGWCLRNPATGFYVKLKCDWYLRMHKARTELRERDCFDYWAEESLDDIKSALSLDGFDLAPIEEIERKATKYYVAAKSTLEWILGTIEDKTDFKSVALSLKNHPMFSLIMNSLRGKKVDIKDYVVRNYRDDFSLKCVYNKNFGVQ